MRTNDDAIQKVNLKVADEPIPPAPAPQPLGKTARLSGEMTGAVLSPAIQEGQHAWHFYDLDTGYRPNWPTRIPRDETARDSKQLAEWASESGVDLMCITHRSPDGTETYVLRALGMVTSYTMAGFVHILLVIAIMVVLIQVMQWARIV